MTIEVRRLEAGDERSGFRSGDADLDRFFHRYAGQNQFRHHIGTTWVAVDAEPRLARLPAYLLPVLGELGDRPLPVTMFLELGAIPRPE